MLDMGAGTTSIAVFQDGAIAYSGCIPLGGQSITSDIAIGLQTSIEDAEKIKLNMDKIVNDKVALTARTEDKTPALLKKGEEKEKEIKRRNPDLVDITSLGVQGKKEVSKSMLTQIVDARLEEIFELARDNVSKAGYDLTMPSGIVLTGGSAMLANITKSSQSILGVPSRVGHPSGLSGMVEEISNPAYASVQGLIRHALDDNIDATGQSKKGSGFPSGISDIFSKLVNWVKSLKP